MKTHTEKSIARRATAAVKAATKAFEAYETGNGPDVYLKAIRRLDKVEDDVRFIETGCSAVTSRGFATIDAAKVAIRTAWELGQAAARNRGQARAEALESIEMDRRRAAFASRGNWNLSGGR